MFDTWCLTDSFRYLPVYLWTRKVDREGGDHFLSFLHIISSKQQQQDVAGGHYKVNIGNIQKLTTPFPSISPRWWPPSGTVSTVPRSSARRRKTGSTSRGSARSGSHGSTAASSVPCPSKQRLAWKCMSRGGAQRSDRSDSVLINNIPP